MSRWHAVDRIAEKTQREMEIRNDLRQWDRDNPEMRHELIVRTIVSGMISVIATNVYLSFCRRIRASGRGRD
jgi:CRISPR/Cas system-associated exonuclease Cas4 (RecB family)